MDVGIANCSSSSVAHAPATGSQHWVVVALVRSDVCDPQSQLCSKSGISSSR